MSKSSLKPAKRSSTGSKNSSKGNHDNDTNGNNSNMKVNPFGVTLKASGGPRRNTVSTMAAPVVELKKSNSIRAMEDISSGSRGDKMDELSRQRQSLRKIEKPTWGKKVVPPPKFKEDFTKRRTSMRKVPFQPGGRRKPPRTSSREYKGPWAAPFTMSGGPVFGVILRSANKDGGGASTAANSKKTLGNNTNPSTKSAPPEESTPIMDFQFRENMGPEDTDDASCLTFGTGSEDEERSAKSIKSAPAATQKKEDWTAPFGVRLKPTWRNFSRSNSGSSSIATGVGTEGDNAGGGARTWQIDLNPNVRKMTGENTYESKSREFLEVKLKPTAPKVKKEKTNNEEKDDDNASVSSNDSDDSDSEDEMVELTLRHVVGAEDGGPKRDVCQASFMVPLRKIHAHYLDSLSPEERRKRLHKDSVQMEDLLHMTIEKLKHAEKNSKDGKKEPHFLKITFRHVDPLTKETQPFGEALHVELKPPRPRGAPKEATSMGVNLRPVKRRGKPDEAVPEWSKIKLGTVKTMEENVSEVGEDGEDPAEGLDMFDPAGNEDIAEDFVDADDEDVSDREIDLLDIPDDWSDDEVHKAQVDELVQNSTFEEKQNLRSSVPNLDYDHKPDDYDEYEEVEEDMDEEIEEVLEEGYEWEEYEVVEDGVTKIMKRPKAKIPVEEWEEYEVVEDGVTKMMKRPKAKVAEEEEDYELWIEFETMEDKKVKARKLPDSYFERNKNGAKEPKEKEIWEEVLEEETWEEEEIIEYEEWEEYEIVEEENPKIRKRPKGKGGKKPKDGQQAQEEAAAKAAEAAKKAKAAAEDAADRGRKVTMTRKIPARTRSRSLTDMDRTRIRKAVERVEERKSIKAAEEETRILSKKQQRDLLMWYTRMKTPTREEMKRRVAKLPKSCDITPEDVDALPWLCRGRILDVRVMNKLFLEDWQGVKDGSDSD